MEADAGDLEFEAGAFGVRGTPGAANDHPGDRVRARSPPISCPTGSSRCSTADHVLDPDDFSFPHGTHLCAVEVDTETGMVKIRSYVCVDDVGKVGQPADRRRAGARRRRAGHRAGAVRGGGLRRRRQPRHRLAGGLPRADRAADLPSFVTDRTETPATTNPLGVKGVGEAGTIASTPAVVNAVVDALRQYGVPTCRCRARRNGCGGRSRTGRRSAPRRARSRTAARRPPRRRRRNDPGGVRVRTGRVGRPRGVRIGRTRRRGEGAGRRAEPAAVDAAAAGRPGASSWTSAGWPICAACARTATRSSSARSPRTTR